jgi:hypothetical protein
MVRLFALLIAASVMEGCIAQVIVPTVGLNHPANSKAEESSPPPRSDTLKVLDPVTFSSEESSDHGSRGHAHREVQTDTPHSGHHGHH